MWRARPHWQPAQTQSLTMLAFSPHARQGKLQPGGTIIEATGGNTGQLTTPRSSHIPAPLTQLMVMVSGVALALGAKSGGFKTLFTCQTGQSTGTAGSQPQG